MCGRIILETSDIDELVRLLNALLVRPSEGALYRPRYNIPPTAEHWQMRAGEGGRRLLERARWSVERHVGPGKKKPLFNARGEGIRESRAWRQAFQERRCVIPATGFYEWRGEKKARQPLRFHRPGGGLVLLAGLYDDAPAPSDENSSPLPGFTVLTTAANRLLSTVHDRMPLILAPEQVDAWLAAPDFAVVRPAPDDALVATPASMRVNAVANDDPDCLLAGE